MNPIGWCDLTRNYIWGCTQGCEYCYARKIAKRFCGEVARKEMEYLRKNFKGNMSKDSKIYNENLEAIKYRLFNFKPTLLNYKLAQPLPKKPQRIFLDSMSDIADWEPKWYEKILQKITENFQHTFILLTKRPEIYKRYMFPHNVWLGMTCVNQRQLNEFDSLLANSLELNNKVFVSLEPIIEPINLNLWMKRRLDWIIVGPETGNRKNKFEIISDIIDYFYDVEIPVYMKSGCSKIIDTPLRQEWPG